MAATWTKISSGGGTVSTHRGGIITIGTLATILALSMANAGEDSYSVQPQMAALFPVAMEAQQTEATSESGDYVADVTDDGWVYDLTPYFWAPAIDVVATVDGMPAALDLSFGDILDEFDVIGGSARLEAWKGRWGFFIDGAYLSLETDADMELATTVKTPGPIPDIPVTVDVDVDIEIVDVGLAYRAVSATLLPRRTSPDFFLDLFGGARYHYYKQEITADVDVATPMGRASEKADLGGSKDWVEPLIGARIAGKLTDRVMAAVRADAGGFGVGSGSDLTWSVLAGLGY